MLKTREKFETPHDSYTLKHSHPSRRQQRQHKKHPSSLFASQSIMSLVTSIKASLKLPLPITRDDVDELIALMEKKLAITRIDQRATSRGPTSRASSPKSVSPTRSNASTPPRSTVSDSKQSTDPASTSKRSTDNDCGVKFLSGSRKGMCCEAPKQAKYNNRCGAHKNY